MASLRPILILISGAPGSGKTTFARSLSLALRLPHVERDAIMSGIQYTQNQIFDRQKVGIPIYYKTLAHLLESGVSLVTDATLYRGKSEADIVNYLLPHCELINVHCRSADENKRFYERELECYRGRAPDWLATHMLHLDMIYPDVSVPLDIGQHLIEVDTTADYMPRIDDLADMIGDRNSELHKENAYAK